MQDFEILGQFYLGRLFDLAERRPRSELLLYDSKDLTTHAVCVGMTGSGKTGLCLALLEEAAIDQIPAIIIDPKGDLGNLLLTFPQLAATDFQPWIDPGEAERQGQDSQAYAAQVADKWRQGLADWGQTPERIAKFRESVDLAIYTPGANFGRPLAMLRSFSAPPPDFIQDADAFRGRVAAAASGLLALLGIDADPLKSREHILLSNLLDQVWREGRDLDVSGLIRQVQSPPFTKLGVMDLETVFPAAERFDFAMQLNNLLASPGFAAWTTGEPLDIGRLLHTPAGKPRLSILSIAHLSDSERMFFVTLLLNELLTWVRAQPGTSSLRAILYMDEVAGYFPPTANPPAKLPMLTLLKQARAFGLGIVLATQNPVDLDYKGLSNAGTWFLGRLQTERDKARVLEGLEGASAAAGSSFDRKRMEETLAALGSRVFLMNNVHENQPVVFQTRWTMSYLRGPLTRQQIETLMRPGAPASPPAGPANVAAPQTGPATAASDHRPVVPPGIEERFAAPTRSVRPGEQFVYRPGLYAVTRLHYVDAKSAMDQWETVYWHLPMPDGLPAELWAAAEELDGEKFSWDAAPDSAASFVSGPAELLRPASYKSWHTALKNHLYQNRPITVFRHPVAKLVSQAGESEGDFRVRVQHVLHEQRDAEIEKLRTKYASKYQTLQDRLRRAQQRVQSQEADVSHRTTDALLSFGTTLLGALMGRKLKSSANVTRAAGSVRAAGRIAKERGEVTQAQAEVDSIQQQVETLDAEVARATEAIGEKYGEQAKEISPVTIRPRKTDISIENLALLWTPWIRGGDGKTDPAF